MPREPRRYEQIGKYLIEEFEWRPVGPDGIVKVNGKQVDMTFDYACSYYGDRASDEKAEREHNERSADRIVQKVAELPNRTSPDDWPDALLVTSDELRGIVLDELTE